MPKYEELISRVEEEEGDLFWDVIRGYAEQGCSKAEVSRLLGFKWPHSFFRLLSAYPEQQINWVPPQQCVMTQYYRERCKDPASAEYAHLKQAAKLARAKNAKRYWVDGIYDTLRGHYERIQPKRISLSGVVNRINHYGYPPERALKETGMSPQESGRIGAIKARKKSDPNYNFGWRKKS